MGQEFYIKEKSNGVLSDDGILTHYNDNGTIQSFGGYFDGNMEGMWRFFREDGSLLETGNYIHSKKDGLWISYDKSGEISSRTYYSMGMEVDYF